MRFIHMPFLLSFLAVLALVGCGGGASGQADDDIRKTAEELKSMAAELKAAAADLKHVSDTMQPLAEATKQRMPRRPSREYPPEPAPPRIAPPSRPEPTKDAPPDLGTAKDGAPSKF